MTPVNKIAQSVPRGIDRAGSLSSPDMFAPAMIPVAAGKNRANMVRKLSPSANLD